MQIVRHDKGGFTLTEVLVAITILTIAMLGALEGLLLYTQHNINNLCRDESVKIAEQKMNELRNISYTSLTSGSTNIKRKIKNFERDFNIQWGVTAISPDSSSVEVIVKWTIMNKEWSHGIRSIINRG